MTTTTDSPRIYVASLSDYNNGHLHGAWIDLDGKDIGEVWEEINAMLAASKYPNVMKRNWSCPSCGHTWTAPAYDLPFACPECSTELMEPGELFPSAEEWAIHDFEGFYSYRVSEGEDLAELVELVEAAEESDNTEAFYIYCADVGSEYAKEHFEESFSGEWDSEKAYAENLLDDLGELDSIPEHLRYYFDYDAYTRDLFINDYRSERLDNGNVAVFNRYV